MGTPPSLPVAPAGHGPARRVDPSGRSRRFGTRRVIVGLVLATLLGAACGAGDRAASGVVIALQSEGATISGFSLRDANGQTLVFRIGDLELDGAAFAASHLAAHAATLAPIAVSYRVENGVNVAHRLVDAPWAGPSP